MGVLVSKPVKQQNSPKKIRTQTQSGSSTSKKPSLFRALSKKKGETSAETTTLPQTQSSESRISPSREIQPSNADVAQQSAVITEEVIDQATVKAGEASFNEVAQQIAEEVIAASIEQVPKEETSLDQIAKPHEKILETTELAPQHLTSENSVELNEVSEEKRCDEQPSSEEQNAPEALNGDDNPEVEGDKTAEAEVFAEQKAAPEDSPEQPEGADIEG